MESDKSSDNAFLLSSSSSSSCSSSSSAAAVDSGPPPSSASAFNIFANSVIYPSQNGAKEGTSPQKKARFDGEPSPAEAIIVISEPPKASESPYKASWGTILIIFSAIACHGLSMHIAQPFLPAMLRKRFDVSENDVGQISGKIMSIYTLASFFSAGYIGHLSDLYGRKLFLAIGAFAISVCTLVFGLGTSVDMLFYTRMAEGLLSSIPGLSRAALSDISVGDPNRNQYFGFYGAVYSLSLSCSSALGGAISGAAENIPELDPYATATSVGAFVCFIAFFMIVFYLPDLRIGESAAVPTQLSLKLQDMNGWQRFTFLLSDPVARRAIIIIGFNNMCNGALFLALTLLLTLKVGSGGPGFSAFQSGLAFMVFGGVGFIYQILFFRGLEKSHGTRKMFKGGVACMVTGCLLLPIIALNVTSLDPATAFACTVPAVILLGLGNMNCAPCVSIFIANAADLELQGLAQGVGQAYGALLRALGIFSSGAIFSYSVRHGVPWLIYGVIAFFYLLMGILSISLPSYVEVGKPRPDPPPKIAPSPKRFLDNFSPLRTSKSYSSLEHPDIASPTFSPTLKPSSSSFLRNSKSYGTLN